MSTVAACSSGQGGAVALSSSRRESLGAVADAGVGDVALAVGRREPSSAPGPDPASLPARADGCSSLPAGGDAATPEYSTDPSPAAAPDVAPVPERLCGWCRSPLEVTRRRWCSKKCRQTAWRARLIEVGEDPRDTPKRLGIADPPYPKLARKYYRNEPTYAGEVDHAALIASLSTRYDGWALCTSPKALRDILPLCPPDVRVCVWVKPIGVSSKTRGLHNAYEVVIVKPARLRRPGVPDFLSTQPARGGGTLMGRKPRRFVVWLLQVLGASPRVDALDDMFPGTGIVTRVFEELRRASVEGVLKRRANEEIIP